MDANRFDSVTKLFASRRLSRRQALAQGKFPKLKAELAMPEPPPSIWDEQA